jgi:chromatin remodeling complex protein RSC6
MDSMNAGLALLYGTPGAPASADDMQKQAEAEMFAKLAADQGIDLNQLSNEQVQYLYAETMGKQANEDKDADDKPKAKKSEEEEEEKKHGRWPSGRRSGPDRRSGRRPTRWAGSWPTRTSRSSG